MKSNSADTLAAVSFSTSPGDAALIRKIAERATKLAASFDVRYGVSDAAMDLTAVHANGCPLDLPKLLAANDGDFGHDAFGIRRFLDGMTGKLGGCFLPRCSRSADRSAECIITREAVTEDEPFQYSAEASQLGWPPGYRPSTIQTTMGNKHPFVLISTAGENEVWHYRQQLGCISLRIFND